MLVHLCMHIIVRGMTVHVFHHITSCLGERHEYRLIYALAQPRMVSQTKTIPNMFLSYDKVWEKAYQLASKESAKLSTSNKKRYDLRVRGSELNERDRVLIRNVGFKGPGPTNLLTNGMTQCTVLLIVQMMGFLFTN